MREIQRQKRGLVKDTPYSIDHQDRNTTSLAITYGCSIALKASLIYALLKPESHLRGHFPVFK
jgi:hypothetical protein